MQHVSHCTLCLFLFPASCVSVVLIAIPLALSLSVVLALSFSLPQNRTLLRAMVVLNLFLSACFHFPFSLLARLLSFSLANRTSNSLILSPTPPPHSFYVPLSHATVMVPTDGSHRPAQMRVISESIFTDSELGLEFVGLEFVATL